MVTHVFALVDCNNFYASCERVFAPEYRNKPVVVLSNNDGCIIARSAEAKELGIPMGAAAFKYQEIFAKHKVKLFSPNFALYGDFSRRVVKELRDFTPNVEVYSIDESFLELTGNDPLELQQALLDLKARIYHNLGIPVSIGVAPTKTLAKCCNRLAKKFPEFGGVANFFAIEKAASLAPRKSQGKNGKKTWNDWLAAIDIQDVWGVGFRSAKFLKARNILTAYDLKMADRQWLRRKMTIQGERLWLELQGICCKPFLQQLNNRQSIACTRSFGQRVQTEMELMEAVTVYTSRVGEKLRNLKLQAQQISVFIRTSGYGLQPQYFNSFRAKLIQPSNFTPTLVKAALQGLTRIYKPGFSYAKAGVIATSLSADNEFQLNFLAPLDFSKLAQQRSLSRNVDLLNAVYGKDTVKIAAQEQGSTEHWQMKQALRSPHYTTVWADLKVVRYSAATRNRPEPKLDRQFMAH